MMDGTSMQTDASTGTALDADAFQRLYPADYYKEFLDQGIRPDGRRFQEARETTIGVGVVSTADASALIRIGSSAAMAGVKLEVPALSDLALLLTRSVNLKGGFCSWLPHWRSGRPKAA